MTKPILAADLFCGAGGTSTGLKQACVKSGRSVKLLAVNHWDVAIETHTMNHPDAEHLCETLDSVDPRKVVPGRKLNILVASPECTHHSNARGGKPMNDQSRASAFHILRWAEALDIDNILIENVTEFRKWGPLCSKGRPKKTMQGELYLHFLQGLRILGYTVDERILNAAYYGDATSRERLFIMARKGKRKIQWPEPSHLPAPDMFGGKERWRAAREIIDWNLKGEPISQRKRQLKPNTLKRIEAGIRKFAKDPKYIEPFLVVLRNNMSTQSIDEPLGALTAGGNHYGLCEPFVLGQHSGSVARSVDSPIPTVAGKGAIALCEPFLVPQFSDHAPRSVDRPLGAITTTSRGIGLIEPFVVSVNHGSESESDHQRRVHDTDSPLPSMTTKNGYALVDPFLTKYYGTAGTVTVDEPLDAITTRERFALVEPVADGYRFDIRFRMLQPHELAAAMGFPAGYRFAGGKSEQTKQIGNAVCVNLAEALITEML